MKKNEKKFQTEKKDFKMEIEFEIEFQIGSWISSTWTSKAFGAGKSFPVGDIFRGI